MSTNGDEDRPWFSATSPYFSPFICVQLGPYKHKMGPLRRIAALSQIILSLHREIELHMCP